MASCDVIAGRRPQGPALLDLVRRYQERAGVTVETDNTRITDRHTKRCIPNRRTREV